MKHFVEIPVRSAVFRRPLRASVVVTLAAFTLSIAACGGGDDTSAGDGVASVDDVEGATIAPNTTADGDAADGSGDGDAAGGAGPMTDAELEEAFADWNACMAEAGVDMPFADAPTGNSVDVAVSAEPNIEDIDMDAFEAAAEECDDLIPQQAYDPLAGMDTETQVILNDFLLELEKCMADKGHDIPYTKLIGGGDPEEAQAAVGEMASMSDEEVEAIDADEKLCEDEIGVPAELEGFTDDPDAVEETDDPDAVEE